MALGSLRLTEILTIGGSSVHACAQASRRPRARASSGLGPDGGGQPDGELGAALDEYFGSYDAFRKQLSEAAITVQGSGWGALSWEPLGERLYIEQIYDHQGNVGQSGVPLLVIDAWEHAYYLQYQNKRADYVDAIWNIVDWRDVATRFDRARDVVLIES